MVWHSETAAGGLPNRPAHEFGAKRWVARGRLCRAGDEVTKGGATKGRETQKNATCPKQAAFSLQRAVKTNISARNENSRPQERLPPASPAKRVAGGGAANERALTFVRSIKSEQAI